MIARSKTDEKIDIIVAVSLFANTKREVAS